MSRIRLTQIFPFLIPIRQKQRKAFFYTKMKFDKNMYASTKQDDYFPHQVYEKQVVMINENSGYDIKYQYNKVFNLKLAAKQLDGLMIRPSEVFSFWQTIRHADKDPPYKNGLGLVNNEIKATYGGGLCEMSNLLFYTFLHSPLTISERHAHFVESFPLQEGKLYGVDATINEGWLDLKMKNNTELTFQIKIDFSDTDIICKLLVDVPFAYTYQIYNKNNHTYQKNKKYYRQVEVWQTHDQDGQEITQRHLYSDDIEIGYDI